MKNSTLQIQLNWSKKCLMWTMKKHLKSPTEQTIYWKNHWENDIQEIEEKIRLEEVKNG